MKNYLLKLKGSKKNNTQDLEIIMVCENKRQCIGLAWQFFQQGEIDVVYGSKETGLATIHKWLPNADGFRHLAGKYKVCDNSVTCI